MSRSTSTAGLAITTCLMLACACSSEDDSSSATTPPAPSESTTAATTTTPPTTAQAPVTTGAPPITVADEPATTEAAATTVADEPATTASSTEPPTECGRIVEDFVPIVPGEYCFDTIGAPFRISVPTGWWVGPNSSGFLVVMDERSQGPGDQMIAFARVTNLTDPDNPTAPRAEQRGDWPLDDIEGWLDNVIPGVLDGEPVDTTLGGHDAISFDVALTDEVECLAEMCIGFSDNNGGGGPGFKRRIGYRLWWIYDDAEAPVVVMAGDGGIPDFIDRAEAVLDTMVIESIGRNPLATEGLPWEEGLPSEVPAGEVRLPLGPGVTFETTSDYFIAQPEHLVGVYAGIQGDDNTWWIDMYVPSVDGDGAPVDTVDDVIAGLQSFEGTETEVVGSRSVGGREATEVSFTSPGHQPGDFPAFPLADDPESGWTIPPEGTMWIIELDDDIMFIVANGYSPGELDVTTEAVQEILDTLTFEE